MVEEKYFQGVCPQLAASPVGPSFSDLGLREQQCKVMLEEHHLELSGPTGAISFEAIDIDLDEEVRTRGEGWAEGCSLAKYDRLAQRALQR